MPLRTMKYRTFFLAGIGCLAAVATADKGASESGQILLGHVGHVVYATAIHSRPTGGSKILCRVAQDTPLVVKQTRSDYWTEVLLNTGTYGYLPTDAVLESKDEVTMKAPPSRQARSAQLTSRGGNISSRTGEAAVASYAQNFIGTPYKWGGNDVYKGIDCSGFVKKMYGAIGVPLPRTAAEQSMVGQPIYRLEDLQSGDRLYFCDHARTRVAHTGIYIGGGYFVHSSSSHHGVARDYLGKSNWIGSLVAARR